ncbi:MAG TPA: RNA polymerase sigma factor, partial [Gemmataceae bacterium]|nr:RNA polymerase sigma factor [Gemmataceae bacterium]
MPLRLARLFPQLRRLTIPPDSDAELLQRFARGRDEAAFAELVARHGPMVFRVCRRVLGDVQTAEDAFQAAFLVLARKAGTLGQPGRLAAWLYGVAYRVALKARQAGRREGSGHGLANAPEPHDPHPDPLSELSARELLAVVEEEVQRLPEAYRWPVILCCLEGLSLEEAAQRLGATTGSLRGRLERGRKRLGDRLAKRGLTLAAALAAVEVARAAPTPALLSVATVRAALAFATNSEAVSGTAAALAKAALPTIASGKVKLAAALLLALSAAAVGAGVLTQVPAAPEERGRPEAIQDGQQQAAGHEQPR